MPDKKPHNHKDKEPNFVIYKNWESTLPEFKEEAVNESRYFYNADF